MTMTKRMIPVGAVVLALSLAGVAADAGQRDSRGRDRNGRESRGDDRRDAYRYDRRDNDRYDSFRYAPAPRYYGSVRHPRYYGPGGSFSVYFGIGNGYLYGSPYAGRVYGYAGPRSYGSRVYYGDIRLQVRPRNAAVYVDGYYAGIVDDFDGVFQRLTLEVGPHEIELDAPGLAPQLFDVYVDPAQTVNLRTELYPY